MQILIINQPLNNRGDESAHKGLIRSLHKILPNCQIDILFIQSNQNSISQFNVQLPNVHYINLKAIKGYGKIINLGLLFKLYFLWNLHPTLHKIIKIYKQADIVICAPGGICMGGFQNWMHLFYLSVAQYLKKPLIYYGRSFGPFPTQTWKNRKFKKISTQLLHYFSFLSIRDKKTEKLAQEMGLNYISTLDSAFLDYPQPIVPKELNKIIESKYIVFVPNLLIWHYAYKGRISKECIIEYYCNMIDIIVKQYPDHSIVMLPQTFNYGTYEGDDIHFFKEIQSTKKDSPIIVLSDQYSSDIQQVIIRNAACMIGARYHSVVFAINNNVPFVALSYEHKIAGLLETLNKTQNMIDITSIYMKKEMQNSIKEFKEKLIQAKTDSNAQILAKSVTENCFHIFSNQFLH